MALSSHLSGFTPGIIGVLDSHPPYIPQTWISIHNNSFSHSQFTCPPPPSCGASGVQVTPWEPGMTLAALKSA